MMIKGELSNWSNNLQFITINNKQPLIYIILSAIRKPRCGISIGLKVFEDKIRSQVIVHVATIKVCESCRELYFAIIVTIAVIFGLLDDDGNNDNTIYINCFKHSDILPRSFYEGNLLYRIASDDVLHTTSSHAHYNTLFIIIPYVLCSHFQVFSHGCQLRIKVGLCLYIEALQYPDLLQILHIFKG